MGWLLLVHFLCIVPTISLFWKALSKYSRNSSLISRRIIAHICVISVSFFNLIPVKYFELCNYWFVGACIRALSFISTVGLYSLAMLFHASIDNSVILNPPISQVCSASRTIKPVEIRSTLPVTTAVFFPRHWKHWAAFFVCCQSKHRQKRIVSQTFHWVAQ